MLREERQAYVDIAISVMVLASCVGILQTNIYFSAKRPRNTGLNCETQTIILVYVNFYAAVIWARQQP